MGVTLSTVITLYLWGAAAKLLPDDPKLMTSIIGVTNALIYVGITSIVDMLDKE